MWGRASLLAIVDDRLSDFAFRVRTLFSVPTLSGGPITLRHQEIAVIMSCSESKAKRVVRELIASRYIEVSRKHNCRNAYSLRDPVENVLGRPVRKQREVGKVLKCSRCQCVCFHSSEDGMVSEV